MGKYSKVYRRKLIHHSTFFLSSAETYQLAHFLNQKFRNKKGKIENTIVY